MNMLPDIETLEPVADSEGGFHPLFADVPSSVEFNKLRKRLLRLTRQAIEDFSMVKPGQRWLV
ncbi:tRNA 2-thiocytidine(32) synthetase TtcA, partial [Mesorhizobium sp. M7A.F.Ca.CA.001.15.1.1]